MADYLNDLNCTNIGQPYKYSLIEPNESIVHNFVHNFVYKTEKVGVPKMSSFLTFMP